MDTPALPPTADLALRRAIEQALAEAAIDLDGRTVVVTIVTPDAPRADRAAPRRRIGREGW
jgi:hypothetical protein